MILVVVGLPGSGKGLVADILKGKGFTVIEFGDIWRGLARKSNIPLSDPLARTEFTGRLRERYGKGVYGKYAVRLVNKSMRDVVFMGLRSTYELAELKKKLRGIKIIAITAPRSVRFRRLRGRNKPEDPKTMEAFIEHENWEKRGFLQDKAEEKHGVMVLLKNADFTLHNVGTREELGRGVERALKKIGYKRA
ncbi:MAG TPA: AAA family ATPase [Candidatus Saccharimonadales bacterium]|nr:AAA family ATPase [Candidatus Saccharimonadales bacterium]